jgi:hypothetical protein
LAKRALTRSLAPTREGNRQVECDGAVFDQQDALGQRSASATSCVTSTAV